MTYSTEKPKVVELQMDWLRSEDLKEEKNVTAPVVIIGVLAGKCILLGDPAKASVVRDRELSEPDRYLLEEGDRLSSEPL
jgi:hypothetical protein